MLTLLKTPVLTADQGPEPFDMSESKPRVLLVDDNDTDNLISRRVIELSGFANSIHICNSGKNALEYIESHIDAPTQLPDVIFLDINMPIVDGFVFLYEFEQMAPRIEKAISVIVLSSSDSRQDIERMQLHPRVVKFITKPLAVGALQTLSVELSRD